MTKDTVRETTTLHIRASKRREGHMDSARTIAQRIAGTSMITAACTMMDSHTAGSRVMMGTIMMVMMVMMTVVKEDIRQIARVAEVGRRVHPTKPEDHPIPSS